ncbi:MULTISPECIES: hypothetical protein [Streptomyces]|nr:MULTISPECIES: hypothetical protein [unclassified Streptomyces]MDX2919179.1 hypothetical protein [Streptomyces sp. NE06-03C]MDX3609663.1 hypothetical protein [Streptomyces sp. FL06-04B]MDX3734906.1 hypothetical protein [Streptomyces sp. ID01-15D]
MNGRPGGRIPQGDPEERHAPAAVPTVLGVPAPQNTQVLDAETLTAG